MKGRHIFLISALFLVLGAHSAGAAITIVIPGEDTLQNAIDGASDGDILVLKTGDYTATPLTAVAVINGFKKLTIIGAGQDRSHINGEEARDGVEIINSDSICLKNLAVIRGKYHNISLHRDSPAYYGYHGVNIVNCTIDGLDPSVPAPATHQGIEASDGMGLHIRNCRITNHLYQGIDLLSDSPGNHDFQIVNNLIDTNGDQGIYIEYGLTGKIARNEITNNGTDGIRLENGNYITTQCNTIEFNGENGIDDDSSGGFNNYHKRNIVNNNGWDGMEVNEAVFVMNSTLSANGWCGVSIDTSFGSLIKSNFIQGNGQGGFYSGEAGNSASNNYVSSNGEDGIYIYGEGSFATCNRVIDNTENGVVNEGNAATIARNFSDNNVDSGLDPSGGSVITERNRSTNNGDRGISTGSTSCTTNNNLVSGNSSHGIQPLSSGSDGYGTIHGNRVCRNGGDGIYRFQNSEVSNNFFWSNVGSGINATNSDGALIRSNFAYYNGDNINDFDLRDDTAPAVSPNFWENNWYGTSNVVFPGP